MTKPLIVPVAVVFEVKAAAQTAGAASCNAADAQTAIGTGNRTWTWLAVVLTSSVLSGCGAGQDESSIAAAVSAGAAVHIVYHADPSKCVDVDGSSDSNNARIVIADCSSASKSQLWGGTAVSGAYGTGYQLINVNSSLCADTSGASTAEHAPLDQIDCGPASKADQAWKVTQSGSSYSFQSANSGLCIDLPNHDTTNGTQLQQYTCTANDTAQLFDVVAPSMSSALPDLVIASLSMSPASPAVGLAVTFSVVVKNQGATATPAGVEIGVGFHIDSAEVTWSGNDTTSLAAGASVTLTASGGPNANSATWIATKGTHTLEAIVNDVNRFPESSTANNSLSKTFTVGNSSGHSVALSWNASTTAGVTYNVYRGTTSGGPYSQVQSGITSTAATDATVSASTTYYYVVRAQNAGGESGSSNEITAVIP